FFQAEDGIRDKLVTGVQTCALPISFLSFVSDEGIHQTLRMMERPAKTRLTPEITRQVCQRTNSTAALDGSIALIGTRYNLILKAVNCVNGELLASTKAQASDKSRVLDALGKVALE